MDYPECLLALVKKAADQHRDDINAAVDCAEKAFNELPERGDIIADLIRGELRSLIHNFRHADNVAIKRELGVYGQKAKVTLGTGAVERVARNCLVTYSICGVALGKITGKQLLVFAASEHERANGHAFNARLCRRLAEIVPEDKAVADVVSVKKAEAIMRECSGKRKVKAA